MPSDLEVIVELYLPTEHLDPPLRFTMTPLRGQQFHAARLLELGTVTRELSLIPEEHRIAELSATFDNSDGFFMRLRRDARGSFLGQRLAVRLGRVGAGSDTSDDDDFPPIFDGEIASWSATADRFTFDARSAFQRRLDEPVTPHAVITTADFPDAPADSQTRMVPLVIGTIDSRQWGGTGAIAAVPIDSTGHRFALCQDTDDLTLSEVSALRVLVDGEEVPLESADAEHARRHRVETFVYGGFRRCLTAVFAEPQEGVNVTADISGLWDSRAGGPSGNPLALMRRFLELHGFVWDRPGATGEGIKYLLRGLRPFSVGDAGSGADIIRAGQTQRYGIWLQYRGGGVESELDDRPQQLAAQQIRDTEREVGGVATQTFRRFGIYAANARVDLASRTVMNFTPFGVPSGQPAYELSETQRRDWWIVLRSSVGQVHVMNMPQASEDADDPYIWDDGVELRTFLEAARAGGATIDMLIVDSRADGVNLSALSRPTAVWEGEADTPHVGIDATTYALAERRLSEVGIDGALWVVDRERVIRDVIDDFARSTNATLFAGNDGRVTANVPEPGEYTDATVTVAEDRIAENSMRMRHQEDVASTIDYGYRYTPADGHFEAEGTYHAPRQLQNLGREVRVRRDLPYTFSSKAAARVIRDRAYFMAEERIVLQFSAAPELYRQVAIGDDIWVRHYAGAPHNQTTAPSGRAPYGFRGRDGNDLFRVLGIGLRLADRSLLVDVTAVDMLTEGTFATAANDWKKYARFRRDFDGIRQRGSGL